MIKLSLKNQMPRIYIFVAGGYGLWIALNILITFSQYSKTSVGAYLALLITGFPGSLLSLFCTLDGSILAVVQAGLLGLAQWLGVTYWVLKRKTSANY